MAVAALSLPSALLAQPIALPDSSPFRAGQWGAEFGLGSFSSVGALRFRSSTTAWFGAISGLVDRRSGASNVLGSREELQLELTLGHRWYRSVTTGIWQYATVGALAGYRSSESTSRLVTVGDPNVRSLRTTSEQFGGGAFADVGAQWMVTPQLALGASWQAQASVGRQRVDEPFAPPGSTDERGTTLNVSLGRVAIRGALYF